MSLVWAANGDLLISESYAELASPFSWASWESYPQICERRRVDSAHSQPQYSGEQALYIVGTADCLPGGCECERTGSTTHFPVVAWIRDTYPLTPLFFTTFGRLETWPWGLESRRAVSAPFQLQHREEQVLHLLGQYSRAGFRCGCCE